MHLIYSVLLESRLVDRMLVDGYVVVTVTRYGINYLLELGSYSTAIGISLNSKTHSVLPTMNLAHGMSDQRSAFAIEGIKETVGS